MGSGWWLAAVAAAGCFVEDPGPTVVTTSGATVGSTTESTSDATSTTQSGSTSASGPGTDATTQNPSTTATSESTTDPGTSSTTESTVTASSTTSTTPDFDECLDAGFVFPEGFPTLESRTWTVEFCDQNVGYTNIVWTADTGEGPQVLEFMQSMAGGPYCWLASEVALPISGPVTLSFDADEPGTPITCTFTPA